RRFSWSKTHLPGASPRCQPNGRTAEAGWKRLIVYLEQLTSALYLDKPEEVAQYEKAMARLHEDSPGPEESRDLLRGLLQLT
ncbi:Scr1 family TA system antitoxin-like transcriptional regulator, partial [Streptomyces sp. NPDC017862]|uniref:Scr1 family TA system antitoxin-like transcriptional regulator n=2 Tax=Streptomyces TaxID=1883 RepID=UPI0037945D32